MRIATVICLIVSFAVSGKEVTLPSFSLWQAENYEGIRGDADIFRGQTLFVSGKVTPFLFSPKLTVNPEESDIFEFKFKCGETGNGRLFYRFKNGEFNDTDRIDFNILPGSDWQTCRLRLPRKSVEGNNDSSTVIEQFRLTLIHKANVRVELANPTLSHHADLPAVDRWVPYNYDNIKVDKNYFSGRTIFEIGKKTPFLFSPNCEINLNEPMVLRFQLKTNASSICRLFYRQPSREFTDDERVDFKIITDPDFRTYQIYLPVREIKIEQLRLDLIANGADIEIKNIELLPAKNIDKPTLNVSASGSSFVDQVADISVMPIDDGIARFGVVPSNFAVSIQPGNNNPMTSPRCYLNFLSPGNQYLIELETNGTAHGELGIYFYPFDVFGKDLRPTNLKMVLQDSTVARATFQLPKRTAWFSIGIIPGTNLKIPLSISKIRLSPVIRPEDRWQGNWIWHNSKTISNKSFFRKTFDLQEKPLHARLLISVDDEINAIYLNGKTVPLGQNASNVLLPDNLDVTSFLQTGRNVLGVAGTDYGGDKGLRCELSVQGKKTYELIPSDSSFKASDNAIIGWEKVDFDDKNWACATIMPHILTQGYPHVYMGPQKPLEYFKIIEVKVDNGELRTKLELKPYDTDMTLNCSLQMGKQAYPVGSVSLPDLFPGTINQIEFAMPIFAGIPAGEYRIQLDSPDNLLPTMEPITLRLAKPVQASDLPEVKIHYADNGRTPMLSINGKISSLTHNITPDCHWEQVRNIKANHVQQYWLALDFKWKSPGDYDFSQIDRKIMEFLQVSPDAYIVIQIPIDTFLLKSMKPWLDFYPGEVVLNEHGDSLIDVQGIKMKVPSWGSDIWRSEVKTIMTYLVRHVRKQPYASRIIGFMPIAGMGAEWMYYGAHNNLYVDYSTPFRNKFCSWLKQRYGDILNLNQAWKTNYAGFANVVLPSRAERETDANFTFIDPSQRRNLIDLRMFFSELVSDIIDDLGKCVKAASDRRSLYGTYYGYITYTAFPYWSENGHFNLQKILNSPNIDFLVSLIRYENRFVGGESGSMTPVNSFAIHGKAAILQSDLRTHRSPERNLYGTTSNLPDSVAVLKRELAWALVTGTVFEFGYYGFGWIESDTRLMELIGRYQQLEMRFSADRKVFNKTSNQFAIIVDDHSFNYILQKSFYGLIGIHELIRQLPHAGVGFDIYMLSDLPKISEHYRCFIFANTYLISQEQIDFIKRNLQKNNHTLVWLHAPGITDGQQWNPERVADLAGIRMQIVLKSVNAVVKVSDNTTFMKQGDSAFILRNYSSIDVGPRLIPSSGKVWARTSDGVPALVCQKFTEWTSVYSWTPNLSSSVLREIASVAGLIIINPNEDDSTYAAGRLIAIHTNLGGARRLTIPATGVTKLTELFSKSEYSVKDGISEVYLEPKSTYLFVSE